MCTTLKEWAENNQETTIYNRTGSERYKGKDLKYVCTVRLYNSKIKIKKNGDVMCFFKSGFLGSKEQWYHFFSLYNSQICLLWNEKPAI